MTKDTQALGQTGLEDEPTMQTQPLILFKIQILFNSAGKEYLLDSTGPLHI